MPYYKRYADSFEELLKFKKIIVQNYFKNVSGVSSLASSSLLDMIETFLWFFYHAGRTEWYGVMFGIFLVLLAMISAPLVNSYNIHEPEMGGGTSYS